MSKISGACHVNRRELLTQLEKLELPVQTVPSFSEVIAGQARINDIRDLEIEDLLGRDPVRPDNAQVASSLFGRAVMVTGAGGSIGSELSVPADYSPPAEMPGVV